MSQTDAQAHREQIRADLRDELVTHDPTRCDYCRTGTKCLELHYAQLADEMVEARLRRRTVGGPT